MESARLCLACQRGLAALLASNPSSAHSPTLACLCVVHYLSPPGWGRRHWAEPGPFTDWAAFLDPSRSQGTRRLDGERGSSVRLRVLQGSMGSMGSKQIQSRVPSPKPTSRGLTC